MGEDATVEVVGNAANGVVALKMIPLLEPDVVISKCPGIVILVERMAEAQFDHPVPELTEQEDAETLAAIDRGIGDARAGRVVSLEDARRYIDQWHLRSSLPKQP
jgi:predicted transcriptional regulator